MFEFPYPLRAHLKFRCSFTADSKTFSPMTDQSKLNGKSHSRTSNGSSVNYADNLQEKSQSLLNYMTNNNAMFAISNKRHIHREEQPQTKKFISDKCKVRKDCKFSYSIEELVGKTASQRGQESGLDSHSDSGSAFRKVEKVQSLSPEQRVSTPTSPACFIPMAKTASSPVRNSSPDSGISIPSSSPRHSLQMSPVQKAHHSLQASSTSSRDHPSMSFMPPPPRPSVKTMSSGVSSIPHIDPTLSGTPIMGLYMSRIPLISPPSPMTIPRGSLLAAGTSSGQGIPLPHTAFPDQIPPGLLEMCRATIPTIGPLTESFAANIRNSESLAKQALFADRHISSLGFLKSTNPMVEKLLQSTNPTLLSSPVNALNLSQNWCAKCNATFRMTSDLVYHMR